MMAIGPFISYMPPGYDPLVKLTTRGEIRDACNRYVMDGISAEELWEIVDKLADRAHVEEVLNT